MRYTFDSIRNSGRLLYEYMRGSHLFGLANEDSDVDTSGMFIAPTDDVIGLRLNFKEMVSDERNDTSWYEVGKFMSLLSKSNPMTFEALYAPMEMIVTAPHRAIMPLFEARDEFVTKECLKPFVWYAREQISKARGLNKKIVNPVNELLTPFDFAYTPYKQGTMKILKWIGDRGLMQEYCGLVSLPNMHNTYGIYYDYGMHFEKEGTTLEGFVGSSLWRFVKGFYNLSDDGVAEWFHARKPIGYRGMLLEGSTQFRSSSISKGEKPLCFMTFNQEGYSDHVRKYYDYKKWERERNPKRYESNLHKNYDSKNMSHCMRLIHMGIEIARGDGVILDRRIAGDAPLLIDIKNHKFEYEEVMAMLDEDMKTFDEVSRNSTLKECVDKELVDAMLVEIRKKIP